MKDTQNLLQTLISPGRETGMEMKISVQNKKNLGLQNYPEHTQGLMRFTWNKQN